MEEEQETEIDSIFINLRGLVDSLEPWVGSSTPDSATNRRPQLLHLNIKKEGFGQRIFRTWSSSAPDFEDASYGWKRPVYSRGQKLTMRGNRLRMRGKGENMY